MVESNADERRQLIVVRGSRLGSSSLGPLLGKSCNDGYKKKKSYKKTVTNNGFNVCTT